MKVGIGFSNQGDSSESGRSVAAQALAKGGIEEPSLVLAFCSGRADANRFFHGLRSVVGDAAPIIGGSAVGVITNSELSYRGHPCGAMVIQSDTPLLRIASCIDLPENEYLAGRHLAEKLNIQPEDQALLVFYDSIREAPAEGRPLALNASAPLIAGIEKGSARPLPIFGAGLIGDYEFNPTVQFSGSHVETHSVVGAAIGAELSLHYRITHGCTPLDGVYHRVTRAEGAVIYELDDEPAVAVIDRLYGTREWQKSTPVDLLTIGIYQGDKYTGAEESRYVNRLITGVLPDGKGVCLFEPDIETGAEVQFMVRDALKMIESARSNAAQLTKKIESEGRQALFALYIDCAGRTAAYSKTASEEAAEIQTALNRLGCPLLGFYSGVEIAPFVSKNRGLDWTGLLLVATGS